MGDPVVIALLTAGLLLVTGVGLRYQRRQADATDRTADADEGVLALEEERRAEERRREQEKQAPRFEPLTGIEVGPGAFFVSADRKTFEAHLWNVGPTVAEMASAELEVVGRRFRGSFSPGSPGPISGGRQSKFYAAPNAHVAMHFDVEQPDLLIQVNAPLGLHVAYAAFDGAYEAELFLPLHRDNAAVTGQLLWRAGDGRVTRV